MKVVLVAIDFLPNIGGVSLMSHHLANSFVDQGCDVVVVSPKGTHIPAGYEARYKLVVDEGSNINIRCGHLYQREEKRIRVFFEELCSETLPDRVLLMHSYYYAPAIINFCNSVKVPTSLFFYAFELRGLMLSDQRSIFRKLFSSIVKRDTLIEQTVGAINDAQEVLAISTYTKGLIGDLSMRTSVFVTGCGLSVEDIKAASNHKEVTEIKRQYNINTEKNVIFCGRLVTCKGVDILLRAIALIPDQDIGVIIIGDGPERDELKSLAKSLGISSRVYFAAGVSEDEKWKLMSSSDVFCLPSYPLDTGQIEGFGIVLLEASASGLPVIASRAGGMVDVVKHEETGLLFEIKNERQLKNCILKLLNDDELSTKVILNAKKQIEKKYNWNSIAKTMISRWYGASS